MNQCSLWLTYRVYVYSVLYMYAQVTDLTADLEALQESYVLLTDRWNILQVRNGTSRIAKKLSPYTVLVV